MLKCEYPDFLKSRGVTEPKPLDNLRQCSICFEPYDVDGFLKESPLTAWLHTLFYDSNQFTCYFCMEWHCGDCMVQHQDCPGVEQYDSECDDSREEDPDEDEESEGDPDQTLMLWEEAKPGDEAQRPESSAQSEGKQPPAKNKPNFLPIQLQFILNSLNFGVRTSK